MFGMEFYSLNRRETVFALNSDKLFVPASTTKLLTEGAALELLGPEFRFHTRVYRTGPVSADGTLRGDVVLVASGDPNLSGRIRPDGTLAFENVDHSYDGSRHTRAVPGDPLMVIRDLARQIAARGVRRVEGRVLVDKNLFGEGEKELGTDIVISPIVVNDNIVDVTVSPGGGIGAPVRTAVSPQTSYVRFDVRAKTSEKGSRPKISWENPITHPDGTLTVTLAGNMPLGAPSTLFAYPVPEPHRFAEVVLEVALRENGIALNPSTGRAKTDFKAFFPAYVQENLLAEHVSPPLKEEVKVTLKVSQNLHAGIVPYLLGALLAPQVKELPQAGFDVERQLLQSAGLDLSGASQSDGAGGDPAGCYTPAFMVRYLELMAQQRNFPAFLNALPILGRDGTLWNIQPDSPAAGHVQAKTGTLYYYDALNCRLMVTAKGLAGYITTPKGKRWAFAAYANRVSVPDEEEAISKIVGQAMGEIANAGYLAAVESEEE